MPITKQLHISSPGLADQDLVALRTAVKLLSQAGQSFSLEEKYKNSAHLLVLDEESDGGRAVLKNSRAGQVKLLLSSQPQTGKNVVAIQKPVDINTLKNLLSKLFVVMQAQLLKATQSLHADKPVSDQSSGTPTENMFDLLLDIKANRRTMEIKSESLPTLLVDGENRSVATSGSMDDVIKTVQTPANLLRVKKLDGETTLSGTQQLNISSLDTILWVAAIECSKGKLLPGHTIDKPVKLKAWPNFSRTSFRPDHLKLAAMLARNPLTLAELSQFSQVPYDDVVDFYNAAYSVDLIEFQENLEQMRKPEQKQDSKRLGLLSKIAKRLALSG